MKDATLDKVGRHHNSPWLQLKYLNDNTLLSNFAAVCFKGERQGPPFQCSELFVELNRMGLAAVGLNGQPQGDVEGGGLSAWPGGLPCCPLGSLLLDWEVLQARADPPSLVSPVVLGSGSYTNHGRKNAALLSA